MIGDSKPEDDAERARLREQELEMEALSLFIAGAPPESIAKRQGCTRAVALSRLQRGVQVRQGERDQLAKYSQTVIADRLEMLYRAYVKPAMEGDLAAAKYVLQVHHEVVALTGAAEPNRSVVEVQQAGDLDQEIASLVAVMEQNAREDALRALPAAATVDDEGPETE
ncbi:hypothetical protein FK268_12700 [Tsukamurella sputi]|uniref:Helix-turn-helix DNA binding domain protein n=1 Tax=Tsukamurella sputi TaxID=2591848 RepID=A0A5C5RP90_9ACTN|nr:hypothetical protein [Tsukamurella sputi]TWS24442.1 hypothetical protein FK268_12700 [Tsukamurella sputi]